MGEALIQVTLTLLLIGAALAFASAMVDVLSGKRFNLGRLLVVTTAACVALSLWRLLGNSWPN